LFLIGHRFDLFSQQSRNVTNEISISMGANATPNIGTDEMAVVFL